MASVAFKYVPQTAATTFAFSSVFFFFYDADCKVGCSFFAGPTYYPLYPISTVEDPLNATPSHLVPSPMAPLEPPWPHLPPLEVRGNKKGGGGGGGGGSLNASTSSASFRQFLAAQAKWPPF